jgi:hypothetical protein
VSIGELCVIAALKTLRVGSTVASASLAGCALGGFVKPRSSETSFCVWLNIYSSRNADGVWNTDERLAQSLRPNSQRDLNIEGSQAVVAFGCVRR